MSGRNWETITDNNRMIIGTNNSGNRHGAKNALGVNRRISHLLYQIGGLCYPSQ